MSARLFHLPVLAAAVLALSTGCGGSSGAAGETEEGGGAEASESADAGDGGGASDGGGSEDGGDGDGDTSECTWPVELVDTSSAVPAVGDGSPGSCTAAALASAVSAGGVITFDCGPDPVVIPLDGALSLPLDVDTTVDGGGRVTLDGSGVDRIFVFDSPNFRATETTVTLQRLRLQNGRAPATDFTEDPGDGCAWGYRDGAGGAVYVRDGRLHVIDVEFVDNHAATPGPDVGGGAIYAVGSLGVVIAGSRFVDNDGSNAGAVGLLQSTGTFVDDLFEGNRALGTGTNYVQPGCPNFNHDAQGGAGGNGGAIAVDGEEESELHFCGCRFSGNEANELGGAVFRTPNAGRRDTTFERCRIDANRADGGGGLYISNSHLRIAASTIDGNVAAGLGGGVRTELATELELVNSTFWGNRSSGGLGGALSHSDGGGEIRNCTFGGNLADGGPGRFTAAIRGTTASVHNTIFADNLTEDPYNPMQCWFEPHPGADNLQWPETRSDSSTPDTPCVAGIAWGDPELGALQDHGGPTPTALPGASLVMGAGADCPATDQRGEARPRQGCTLGAVELP